MDTEFRHLFASIRLGPKTAKNRIVFPCHGTGLVGASFMADGGSPDRYIAYQVARARGGCGLHIIGTCPVHSTTGDIPTPAILIPKLKRIAGALHEHGALVLLQLYHRGSGFSSTTSMPNWALSELPSRQDHREVSNEMDDDEINEILDSFAKYAAVAKEGEMDGVEIHACHGDLVQQSWSAWGNQRTDKWGAPMAFANELVGRVRAAVGDDLIVEMRITTDDLLPGGLDNEANARIAQALEATGKLDFLNTSFAHGGGSYAFTIGSMYIPPGSLSIPLTSGIKMVLQSIPICAVSRINDPTLAERAIAEGHCDMVGIVRGQIADPEFANKAREGWTDDIRLCIGCSQGCAKGLGIAIEGVLCTQNAVAGREAGEFALLKNAPKKKRVLVIGGGPAGMEAARVATLRGHDVTLYEKENQLGGQINTLSKAPGREEFRQAVRYLVTQLDKLGVKLKLGIEATAETVMQEKPDAVVVATGSTPYVDPVPGSEQDNVVTPSQVLDGRVTVGERVIVYDTTGLQEAPTVADFLADSGKKVEIVTPFPTIAVNWGAEYWRTNMATIMAVMGPRLRRKGVVFTGSTNLKDISGRTVTVSDIWSEEERTIDDVDTIVMATGYRPNKSLYRALKGHVGELYRIGDCYVPRRLPHAITTGYEIAFNL